MKTGWISSRSWVLLVLFLGFQNCSPFLAQREISSLYPYNFKTSFFADVKLIGREDLDDRIIFSFDMVISDAQDPRRDVDYIMRFRANEDNEICGRSNGVVNNLNNHIRVRCESVTDPDDIIVEIFATNVDDESQSIVFVF